MIDVPERPIQDDAAGCCSNEPDSPLGRQRKSGLFGPDLAAASKKCRKCALA